MVIQWRPIVKNSMTERVELRQAGRREQPAVAAEEQAVGGDDAAAPELNRPDLVPVRVVHVGERRDKRHPQSSVPIYGGGPDGGRDDRQLAAGGIARPRGRQFREQVVDLTALHLPLEDEPAGAVELQEHRNTGLKDEVGRAVRTGEGNATVQRQVYVAVVFMAGRAK